jgi:two-component system, response regulator YesN
MDGREFSLKREHKYIHTSMRGDYAMNVLIVDDEPLEREVLMDIVKRNNFRIKNCMTAENGAEAVQVVQKQSIDVVVLDIKMPVMDGIMAAKIMKQHHPDLKVIFLTAFNDFDYALQTIKIGVEDFLLKPVRPQEFMDALRKVTGKAEQQNKVANAGIASPHIIEIVTEFISEHLGEKLSLARIAEIVHLHPQYLGRLFKQEKDMTVSEFITMKRIEKAKKWLIHSDQTVTEIGEACGFADVNYFSKVFSKLEGVPPKKYRKYNQLVNAEKKNHYFNKIM